MEASLILVCIVGFGIYQALESRKVSLIEVYRELRSQLTNRYDLIPEMMAIVKKYLPTEGGLLEKIIKVRLGAAERMGKAESSFTVQHEIYQILSSLVDLIEQGQGIGCKDIKVLKLKMLEIEKNISSTENFYLMVVNDYNRFIAAPLISLVAKTLRMEKSEVYQAQKIENQDSAVTSEELWGEIQELSQFA